MSAFVVCFIGIAGGFGAMARFGLDTAIKRRWSRAFPLSTLVINMLACVAIGVLAALLAKQGAAMAGTASSAASGAVSVTASSTAQHSFALLSHDVYTIAATGFLGGFSTFSTVINESLTLLRTSRWRLAAGYLAATALLTLLAIWFGWWLGGSFGIFA